MRLFTSLAGLLLLAAAAHCVVLVLGAFSDPLFSLAALAGLAPISLAFYAAVRSKVAPHAFAITFFFGNVVALAYANVGYIYLTDLPLGRHHDVTIKLTAMFAWAGAAGAVLGDVMLRKEPLHASARADTDNLLLRRETLLVAGAIFSVYALVRLSEHGLAQRYQVAEEDFGAGYLMSAVSILGYVLFYILGRRLSGRLLAPGNAATIVVTLVLALTQGLTGGRSGTIRMLLIFLIGALGAPMLRQAKLGLMAIVAVVAMVFIGLVGEARSSEDFRDGDLAARAMEIGDAAVEIHHADDGGYAARVVSRIFEESAQIVIDSTVLTGHRAGFENFERLKHIMVPKALAPEKERAKDGLEILVRDYGIRVGPLTGVPITLIADTYRRGGEQWILVVGFFGGLWLRVLGWLTAFALRGDFYKIGVALLSLRFLSKYGTSLIGFIRLTTFNWARDLLIFVALALALTLLHHLRARGSELALSARSSPPR